MCVVVDMLVIGDRRSPTSCRWIDLRSARLLNDMRQLVREQIATGSCLRIESVGAKRDVAAEGIGVGPDCLRCLIRKAIVVNAHLAKIKRRSRFPVHGPVPSDRVRDAFVMISGLVASHTTGKRS